MKLSLKLNDLVCYINCQINNFFPDKVSEKEALVKATDIAIQRLEFCFKHVSYKSYCDADNTYYDHLRIDQNISMLWYLSNTCFKGLENDRLATKLYYLNKVLHSFDCMYDTSLPDIFLVFHGAGTVLGKATYSDFFTVAHGCTIGNHNGIYPEFGKGVALTANSSVIGRCKIGKRVNIGTRSFAFNTHISDDSSLIFNTQSGKMEIKNSILPHCQQCFNVNLQTL